MTDGGSAQRMPPKYSTLTSAHQFCPGRATGWLNGLEVTAGGTGIVSHAGVALLRARLARQVRA